MFPVAVSIKPDSYRLLKITDSQPFDLARQELEASWSEDDVSRVTIMHDGGHDHPSTLSPLSHASPSVYSLGETAGGRKTTLRSPKVLPETVIYDVELTLSLPAGVSAASGINAIAHAVEALYARNSSPIIALIAEEGIAALARNLPRVAITPDAVASRTEAQYGAWLCGVCLGAVGMALHHKVCHS